MGLLVTIEHDIPDEDISSLLTSAFEGGSNYWYFIKAENRDEGMDYGDCPLTDLGWLDIIANCDGEQYEQDGKKVWRLNREALKRGIQIMATKYPRHMANVLNENADAETGDVFLQCCLFGDVVFG